MLRCFSAAVAEEVRVDPAKSSVQALNDVIARYNSSTSARNTAVEGNEKLAMQFLVTQSEVFCQLLEGLWRVYKVRESPMNATALAKPWLRCEGRPQRTPFHASLSLTPRTVCSHRRVTIRVAFADRWPPGDQRN